MDRRQRKTRTAIFEAFIRLLAKSTYDKITVGQIIAAADIGRATFYAHFETKEYLLKALCQELFEHIFATERGDDSAHTHIFDCDSTATVFTHLFRHLQHNDNHILDLLSCQSNGLFLEYFKKEVVRLVQSQLPLFAHRKARELPEDYWIDHIAASLVQTLRWWIGNGMVQSPEEIANYFLLSV